MSRRRLLVLTLAATLLAPGLSADAAPPKIPTLAGTVRVFATTSTTIDVRLPRAVNIGDGYKPPAGTSVTGAGRTIGALLVKADLSLTGMDVVRYNFCDQPGCSTPIWRMWFHGSDGKPGAGRPKILPAGVYRLNVITDGKPVSVVLKFPGLKGTVDIRPTRAMHVKHESPNYLGSTGGAAPGTFYSGSVPVVVDGGTGIVLHQFYVETDMTAQQQGGFCSYAAVAAGTAPEPAPECPGGTGTDITITELKPDGGQWAMTGRWKFVEEGEYRAGAYYRTVGVAHDPFGTITTMVMPPSL